jgi:hypothetical protein
MNKIKEHTQNITGFSDTETESESIMICHAFIIHFLTRKYMLHIWLKPYRSIAWHKKNDDQKGKLFWIERYLR